MIKIIIVDDHQVFVDALSTLLDGDEDFQVLGTANTPQDGLELLDKHRVDVAVLDFRLNDPDMNGLDVAEYIYANHPATKVLLLTMTNEGRFITQALSMGIPGFMGKSSAGAELKKAIKQVYAGETYYSTDIMKAHMDYVRRQYVGGTQIRLTRREQEILQLLVEEYNTQEMGEILNIGEAGVETHRRNLRSKLEVKNSAGLVREAILRSLVDLDKFI